MTGILAGKERTDDRVRLLDRFAERGFVCLVVGMLDESSTATPKGLRNINGYMAVPAGHPWRRGRPTPSACPSSRTSARHGRSRRSSRSRDRAPGLDGWWIVGFDCAHAGDVTHCEAMDKSSNPLLRNMRDRGDVWRDEDYVRAELRSLALQAASVDGPRLDAEPADPFAEEP
jgi:hypothetical protein